jgi:NAD-dependent DNA ligase
MSMIEWPENSGCWVDLDDLSEEECRALNEQEMALRRKEREAEDASFDESMRELSKIRAKHPEGKGFSSVPKKKKRGGK